MTDTYCYLHLKGAGNSIAEAQAALRESVQAPWADRNVAVWGTFRGLFGVASNELIVMAAAPDAVSVDAFTEALDGHVTVLKATTFIPTVRPEAFEPRQRPGIYVFRFFTTDADSVADFVGLSGDAWQTFEGADSYAAEPQGLFRQAEVGTDGTLDMLLVTWYEDLKSWQTSRRPAPEAQERFARRFELTQRTVALATSLITE